MLWLELVAFSTEAGVQKNTPTNNNIEMDFPMNDLQLVLPSSLIFLRRHVSRKFLGFLWSGPVQTPPHKPLQVPFSLQKRGSSEVPEKRGGGLGEENCLSQALRSVCGKENRRRTNVQQLTCKIDLSSSFYYLFFSFVLLELKPFVLKGKVLGEKF